MIAHYHQLTQNIRTQSQLVGRALRAWKHPMVAGLDVPSLGATFEGSDDEFVYLKLGFTAGENGTNSVTIQIPVPVFESPIEPPNCPLFHWVAAERKAADELRERETEEFKEKQRERELEILRELLEKYPNESR